MERMYRLKPLDTPDSLAAQGGGDKAELAQVNKTWMQAFQPWNPGQQMVIPSAWKPLPDEYPSA